VGQEAPTKGAETSFDRFRAIQGYEIEKASPFRGPKVVGKGQGFRVDGLMMDLGFASMMHTVAGFLCFFREVCILRQI
jgi:hypothetical protein